MKQKKHTSSTPFIKSINFPNEKIGIIVETKDNHKEYDAFMASYLPELASIIGHVEEEEKKPRNENPTISEFLDWSRYENWMVIDWGVEYRDLVDRMRMVEAITDIKERNKKYRDIIVQATCSTNHLFEEEEVIGLAKELRKPEYNHCLEEDLPYLSVIQPQDSYRTKVLLLKAMILNLVVTLVQRIAEMPHYSETNVKGL